VYGKTAPYDYRANGNRFTPKNDLPSVPPSERTSEEKCSVVICLRRVNVTGLLLLLLLLFDFDESRPVFCECASTAEDNK